MRAAMIRTAVAAVAGATLVAMAPATASAAEQCIFQDLKVTGKNRDTVERSLFCLSNLHRLRSGVSLLRIDSRLSNAARAHSDDMLARGFFDHTNPDGAGPSVRAANFGYAFGSGENIATNTKGTARSLFQQWRDSPGHNQNMLSPDYPAAGMGINRNCCPGGAGPGITGTQMLGVGPADGSDDALDFYASSRKCARAREGLILKREARRRARKKGARAKAKAQRLGEQIRELKKGVRKRCDEL